MEEETNKEEQEVEVEVKSTDPATATLQGFFDNHNWFGVRD